MEMLKNAMTRISFLAVGMATTALLVWAQEEKPEENSFLSEAISSAAKKINKVTSGDERLFDDRAKGIDKDILEYDGDPLRRPNTKFPYTSRRQNGGQP